MLIAPSKLEMKARGVGMHTWNVLLNRRRKSFVGVQWSGKEGEKADASSHDMVVPGARCGKDRSNGCVAGTDAGL